MKNLKSLLLVITATSIMISCTDNETNNVDEKNAILLGAQSHESCSYIDKYWGPNAYIGSTIVNQSETNFINNENVKIAKVFNINTVPLHFAKGSGTANAISYGKGYIIYGEQLYNLALSKGGRIACAMVQAHEVGHQLQFRNNLPSRRENTARAGELEADGFAGYYIKKPEGYNAAWSEAAAAYNFAASIGDHNTNSSNHHGTPAQRRSAFRLGYLLGQHSLTVLNFDKHFFFYYDKYVLPGSLRQDIKKPDYIDADVNTFILSKMEELRKINSGEISKEEFEKL